MIDRTTLEDWLRTLPTDASISVDEDGLTLIAHDHTDTPTGDYLEVGGLRSGGA